MRLKELFFFSFIMSQNISIKCEEIIVKFYLLTRVLFIIVKQQYLNFLKKVYFLLVQTTPSLSAIGIRQRKGGHILKTVSMDDIIVTTI